MMLNRDKENGLVIFLSCFKRCCFSFYRRPPLKRWNSLPVSNLCVHNLICHCCGLVQIPKFHCLGYATCTCRLIRTNKTLVCWILDQVIRNQVLAKVTMLCSIGQATMHITLSVPFSRQVYKCGGGGGGGEGNPAMDLHASDKE